MTEAQNKAKYQQVMRNHHQSFLDPLLAMLPLASWPSAVTSKGDFYKFVELLVGKSSTEDLDLPLHDYWTDEMTMDSEESLKQSCFLCIVRDYHTEESKKAIEFLATAARNTALEQRTEDTQFKDGGGQESSRLHDVKAKNSGIVYYKSCQVNGCGCECVIGFGGDKQSRTQLPKAACRFRWGKMYEARLHELMKRNLAEMNDDPNSKKPWWFESESAFHCLFNEYQHSQNHGIDFHCDTESHYDCQKDPIASFTFDSPGVLLVRRKFSDPVTNKQFGEGSRKGVRESRPQCMLVWQEPGNCLVMGGRFQNQFMHAVPARSTWKNIKEEKLFWDETGTCWVRIINRDNEKNWRLFAKYVDQLPVIESEGRDQWRSNITIRWIRHHSAECNIAPRCNNNMFQQPQPQQQQHILAASNVVAMRFGMGNNPQTRQVMPFGMNAVMLVPGPQQRQVIPQPQMQSQVIPQPQMQQGQVIPQPQMQMVPIRQMVPMVSGNPVPILNKDEQFQQMRSENQWLTSTVWDLVESSVKSLSPGSVARKLWQWPLLPTAAADQIQELTDLQSQIRQLIATIEALVQNKIQTDKKIDNWRYCLTQ